ncbi:MAG: streptogramin lyase [Bradymonadia bacterium]
MPSLEVCDGLDNNCNGSVDVGPDGCSVCGSAPELCDELDNDCDGFTDEGVRNTCGVCVADVVPEFLCDGVDEDCDGFTDEGLTNACGTCDESCYRATWAEPSAWALGEFDGVDEENTGDGLRLGSSRASFPDLWVANTDDQTVTRIDTDLAEVVGTFPVGDDPSRTAVDFNGDVFVANRAFGGQGSLTKVLSSGCEGDECVAFTVAIGDLGDIPRGLAIDREGFVWVGTYGGQKLYRVDPESGEIVGEFPVPVNVYGLAIDSEGIIWISTISSDGIGAFDSNTNRYLGSWGPSGCATPYGIAVDGAGNVWAGAWRCDGLIRLDRSRFDEGSIETDLYTHPNMRETRGVAVDGEGMVYLAASGTDRLGKFNPTTEEWDWTIATCDNPIGVGVARDGNIWVMCKDSAEARRYNSDGDELDVIGTGRTPYSYSDMTGFQLRNFTAPSGTWNVTFDCGWADCAFDSVNFDAVQPPGTAVRVRARSRAGGVDATWSAWTPQFSGSPAGIGDLVPNGRFCEIEVELGTDDRDVTPVVRSVEVEWQRP